MLESVVGDDGTAAKASHPGLPGRGQDRHGAAVPVNGGYYRGYTASFIGLAPADDPALVVAVVLDPRAGRHFGGDVAAPVFHDVMAFALQPAADPADRYDRRTDPG